MLICLSQTPVLVHDPQSVQEKFYLLKGVYGLESGLNGQALGQPEVPQSAPSPRWSQTPKPPGEAQGSGLLA